MNHLDFQLYDFAKELFFERLEEQNIPIPSELFQGLNYVRPYLTASSEEPLYISK